MAYLLSCALDGQGSASASSIGDHSLGEIIKMLIAAGLQIEFVHEFPFAARAEVSFVEQGEDG